MKFVSGEMPVGEREVATHLACQNRSRRAQSGRTPRAKIHADRSSQPVANSSGSQPSGDPSRSHRSR